ncbi:MAG: hypothetical protein ACI8TX_001497 [Hyphomicrobiaceae bacterium]|jgi:hypothetical protein
MIQIWLKYAAGFEDGLNHGEWQTVSSCFHSDATYARSSDDERLVTPQLTGREDIVANFDGSVSVLDRRVASRRINSIEIKTDGRTLHSQFTILYQVTDVPPFEFVGSDDYVFDENGLILSLRETIAPGIGAGLIEWLTIHGDALKPM